MTEQNTKEETEAQKLWREKVEATINSDPEIKRLHEESVNKMLKQLRSR